MEPFRILFVDDSSAQVDASLRALADAEFQLASARSIAEAKHAAHQQRFDLVIIDFHIGSERGDVCLRELRTGALPHTRFYLYTTDPDAFRRHRELGFDGVLMLKGRASMRSQVEAVARSIARLRAVGSQ
jgi:DNA-binding NtrC family response regulator